MIKLETTVTTCSLWEQQLWNEIGESESDKDRMLLELERECLEVYRRKVDEAANAKSRLHQSIASKEAEVAALMAALGELNIYSPVKMCCLTFAHSLINPVLHLFIVAFCNSFQLCGTRTDS